LTLTSKVDTATLSNKRQVNTDPFRIILSSPHVLTKQHRCISGT